MGVYLHLHASQHRCERIGCEMRQAGRKDKAIHRAFLDYVEP